MSDLPMKPTPAAPRGLSSAKLAKAIFKADVPEQYLRTLPVQSLYHVVRHNGLGSSVDLLEMAGVRQCRLLLDFDSWQKDEFHEDNFWEWLGLTDVNEDLSFLQKLLKFVDLRVVALLVARYVTSVVNEEPTEEAPGPEYHTPDKGRTWLHVHAPDSTKTFLLARFLALIFETDAGLFYELMAAAGERTQSELMEEAYQEKAKRLAAEGIPDDEFAAQLNAPISAAELQQDLQAAKAHPIVQDVRIITPLLYDTATVQPLGGLLARIQPADEFEAELTLLLNAAVVRWGVEYWDNEQVLELAAKIKGAVNIGLESALLKWRLPDLELYRILGLQKLYRFGLQQLFMVQRDARRTSDQELQELPADSELFAIIAGAREAFPVMPRFIAPEGGLLHDAEGKLEKGFRAFETLRDIEHIRARLVNAAGDA